MKKISITISFLFFVLVSFSQESDYLNPMPDLPISLSGNFAETRPNHFHSGIDIRTNSKEGYKVVAVRGGYVSRIAVQPYGYGRVVYITHDNGTTSVYAHLSRFVPKLEAYIKKMRYQTKTNNVDLFPDKDEFVFKAGEQIAFSGNSGSSGGPHLHFEIRDSRTQNTINVLSSGFYEVPDDIPPRIVALHFFASDTIEGVPFEKKIKTFVPDSSQHGKYSFNAPLKLPCKGFFVLETTDRINGNQFTMGVLSVTEWVDGTPVYQVAFEDFAFAQTRYVNSLTIYQMQKKSKNEILRLSRQQNCNFSGLKIKKNNGIINPDFADSVHIEVLDNAGNTSSVSFAVERDELAEQPCFAIAENSTKVVCGVEKSLSYEDFNVKFAENSMFANSFVTLEKIDTSSSSLDVLSQIYRIEDESVPYFSPVTISLPSSSRKGEVMARYTPENKKLSSIGGKIVNGRVEAKVSNGGYYCLACDTVAPKITPVFPKGFAWASSKSVSFKMSDNFSGVASYSLTIDGKFAILEHVMKQSTLIHNFDDGTFGKGQKHKLVLTVKDGAGNSAVYRKNYTR